MLKFIFLSLLFVHLSLAQTLKTNNNLPVIDVFVESLCPDCMDFIGGSFKRFQEAVDHEELAVVNIYPYGNAHETWDGSAWKFDCQHGANECYGNTIEACALEHLPREEGHNFLICLEGNIRRLSKNFDKALEYCVSEQNVRKTISVCAKGTEGNNLMHIVAQKTPYHNYVPWIHFNGVHDVNIENQILSYMLEFLRGQYEDATTSDAAFLETSASNKNKTCYNQFVSSLEKLNFLQ
jgi:interferon gamma-inducible protein 30